VRGWVLGPADQVPPRMLRVDRLASSVRVFDPRMLELFRWVAERYVAPLASVIGRAVPPRVAGEETVAPADAVAGPAARGPATSVLPGYRGAGALLRAIAAADGSTYALRPAPEDESAVIVESVAACLGAGRRALVIVPEAEPEPSVAAELRAAFGDRVVRFVGGDRRTRYRTWLRTARGDGDVVVATRPGVFAPVPELGLIVVSRESHPALREDRAPYYHGREVALARARLEGAVSVVSALCPSAEVAAAGLPVVEPPDRRWPVVEVVKPGPEGRSPRLLEALRGARRGFLFSPLPGYGVARICRSCGEPASCAACGGLLRHQGGRVGCIVCGADGVCGVCGATTFGIRRGGQERVEEWASRVAAVPVRRVEQPRLPGEAEILVGGPDDVRDLGVGRLDLVGVLDADRAARRPGIAARERALAIWMETVGWARPRGRAIVQASDPADPAVQALVRGRADRFHERDRHRRADAGFPVGAPVFRVTGDDRLSEHLTQLQPLTLLVARGDPTRDDGRGPKAPTVCLVAIAQEGLPAFGRVMRALAADGTVERVEADPHL